MNKHYLNRTVGTLGCRLALFTSEEEMTRELLRIGITPRLVPEWPEGTIKASVSYFTSDKGEELAVVMINIDLKEDALAHVSCLVHEAVHIWQHHLDIIGEREPSKEFEAYGVQHIFDELAYEFRRRWLAAQKKAARSAK